MESLKQYQIQYDGLTVALGLTVVLFAYVFHRRAYSFWQKRGIRGPKPWPLVGNTLQLLLSNRHELDLELTRKYGKVYGIYQGSKPILNVADPDVVRQVCIKDFAHFPNHDGLPVLTKYQKNILLFLRDEHWKRVRSMMSPTFTSGKIKQMYKLLQVCADDLINAFREQLPQQVDTSREGSRSASINLKETYTLYTMNAIATCCYGLKMDRAGATNVKSAAMLNEFVRMGLDLFKINTMAVIRLLVSTVVPVSILKSLNITSNSESQQDPIANHVRKIINSRRASARKFDDYLQILLDAKFGDQMDLDELDNKENHHAGITSETLISDHKQLVADVEGQVSHYDAQSKVAGHHKPTNIELSEMEVLSNAVFLLIVGLETTGSLLTHCTYILAFHQEIQEKLYQEIKKLARPKTNSDHYEFDYAELTSCCYLDAVISETLRRLPPVIQMDRLVKDDAHIEKYNLRLERGMKLNLNYYAIMNDPDYWPNAEQFDPDRFLPENRAKIYPGAYCPFGLGPRHCLGMRFSLTESKLALAKMLMEFRFEPAPGTSWPPTPGIVFGLNSLKKPFAKVVQRGSLS